MTLSGVTIYLIMGDSGQHMNSRPAIVSSPTLNLSGGIVDGRGTYEDMSGHSHGSGIIQDHTKATTS